MKGFTYFEVQEGIWSPRDQSYGYRTFSYHSQSKDANKDARKLKKSGIAFRIIRSQLIAEYDPGEPSVFRKDRERKEAKEAPTTDTIS